ncbi:MAG: hypothetical protein N3E38_01835 [Candidatus Aenigmarchaeota archaeon]|nr:hypothetical protein [Candidatus Aenigmarchaeota archaeon]
MIVNIFILLLFFPVSEAVTLGIYPFNESFQLKPFFTYNFDFYLFNPSEEDVTVYTWVNCFGERGEYKYVEIYPKKLLVEKNTSIKNPKMVLVRIRNPLFVEKRFGELKYFKPILWEEDVKCRVYAKTEGQTSLIVTSELNGKLIGINPIKISVILLLCVLLFIFFLLR